MKPTKPSFLLVVLLVLAVLGLCAARVMRSRAIDPLSVPVGSMALLVVIAVVVLAVAWPVRAWTRGGVRSRFFSPMRAARAAVMAKAACYCGTVLAGWWAGQSLLLVPDLGIESLRRLFWRLVIGAALGVVTAVAGLVAERWCRLPDDDDPPASLPEQRGLEGS